MSAVRRHSSGGQWLLMRKVAGFLIMLPNILPTSRHKASSSACFWTEMYLQFRAKSKEEFHYFRRHNRLACLRSTVHTFSWPKLQED